MSAELAPPIAEALQRALDLVDHGVVHPRLIGRGGAPELIFSWDLPVPGTLTVEDIQALSTLTTYWHQSAGVLVWDRWDEALPSDHPLAVLVTAAVQERFALAQYAGVPVIGDADVLPITVRVSGRDRPIIRVILSIEMRDTNDSTWTGEMTVADAHRVGKLLMERAAERTSMHDARHRD